MYTIIYNYTKKKSVRCLTITVLCFIGMGMGLIGETILTINALYKAVALPISYAMYMLVFRLSTYVVYSFPRLLNNVMPIHAVQ